MKVEFSPLAYNTIIGAPVRTGGTQPAVVEQPITREPAIIERTDRFERTPQTSPISSPNGANMPANPQKFIEKYVNRDVVQNAIEKNPEITRILKRNGLEAKISEKNIDKSLQRHLFTTYLNAVGIAKQAKIDAKTTAKIAQAALLHDIGKALIPEEIIQKPSDLTFDEYRIVRLHSKLGAEILKTTDIDPDVIEAIELHHENKNHARKTACTIAKILSVADVHSALREKRSYKAPKEDEDVFREMREMKFLTQDYVTHLANYRYMIKPVK